MSLQSMPNQDEIKEFSKKLAEITGYIVTAEHAPSHVVLLSRDEESKRNRIIDFGRIGKEYGIAEVARRSV